MKLVDAIVNGLIGVIIGMIIMSGIYGYRIDRYKLLVEDAVSKTNKCSELLTELQDLAHRQQDFIQELTH
jgi:hypothetical protein